MSDLKSLLDVQVLGCERFHCLICCQTQLCSGQQGREPDDGARIPETDTHVDVRSTSKGVSDFTDCFVVKRIMSEMTASLSSQILAPEDLIQPHMKMFYTGLKARAISLIALLSNASCQI